MKKKKSKLVTDSEEEFLRKAHIVINSFHSYSTSWSPSGLIGLNVKYNDGSTELKKGKSSYDFLKEEYEKIE